MSLSSLSARALLIALVLAVGGCGLRPLYAPPEDLTDEGGESVAVDLSSVSVDPIAERRGQLLRNRLSAMLRQDGEPVPEKYRLAISLDETEQSLAIRQTGFATRSNLRITAIYRLIDVANGQPVVAGSVSAISSFDLLDSDFSTLTAIEDARSRVVDRLAADLRNRLAVFFVTQPSPPATP